jgi:hypothetical protein
MPEFEEQISDQFKKHRGPTQRRASLGCREVISCENNLRRKPEDLSAPD